jgi:hypothetical protein
MPKDQPQLIPVGSAARDPSWKQSRKASGSPRAKSAPSQHRSRLRAWRSSSEAPSTASERSPRTGQRERRSAPSSPAALGQTEEATSATQAEIKRLTELLSALKSPEDDVILDTVKSRIHSLKRELTAVKPLEDQISILQTLHKRKTHNLDNLQIFIDDAQKEKQLVGAELDQIGADLFVLKRQRLSQLDPQPFQVADPEAQARIQQQDHVIKHLAAQLNHMQTRLQACSQAPAPSQAASPGPLVTMPLAPVLPGPLVTPVAPVAPVEPPPPQPAPLPPGMHPMFTGMSLFHGMYSSELIDGGSSEQSSISLADNTIQQDLLAIAPEQTIRHLHPLLTQQQITDQPFH